MNTTTTGYTRGDRRIPTNEPLRRLVLAGNMMAAQLLVTAEALDASGEPDHKCIERELIALWERTLTVMLDDIAHRRPRIVPLGPDRPDRTSSHERHAHE